MQWLHIKVKSEAGFFRILIALGLRYQDSWADFLPWFPMLFYKQFADKILISDLRFAI